MKTNTKKIVTGISLIGLSLFLTTPIVNVNANDYGNVEDYRVPYSLVVPFSTTIIYNYKESENTPRVFTYDNYKTLADNYDNGYTEELIPHGYDDIISLNLSVSEESINSNFYESLTRGYIFVDCYNTSPMRYSFQILEMQFLFTNILIDKTFFNDYTLFYISFPFSVDYGYEMIGQYSYISRNIQVLRALQYYDQQSSSSFGIHLNMFRELGDEDAIYIHNLSLKITFYDGLFDINNESANFTILTYYMPKDLIPTYSIFSSLIIGGGFVDLSSFLESSIGGFLSFEIAPGFSIYIILGVIFGLSLLFAILKIYFGG